MAFERINPVALIAGAASKAGPACARALARSADGGLILADTDEAALEVIADSLPRAPERVSTLAFDLREQADWTRAIDFIAAHYGRLDWLIMNTGERAADKIADFDIALNALRAAHRLLADSAHGGAAVLVVNAAAAMKANIEQALRVAAKEAQAARTRLNAIVVGADAPGWRNAAALERIDRNALQKLAGATAPVARCVGYDVEWLLPLILSDETTLHGAALVVDDARPL